MLQASAASCVVSGVHLSGSFVPRARHTRPSAFLRDPIKSEIKSEIKSNQMNQMRNVLWDGASARDKGGRDERSPL
eukprot:5255924-Pyramimonas_sp.AAC.1